MPVLDALPHLKIILGLKGILDFYYWKGVPCVRKWPVTPPSSRSPASMASARLFGAIVAAYSLLGAALKELFALDAADQPRTARDLFVSAVLGHLHDHNMSDFLDLLTAATAYLEALAPLADALVSIGTDQLLALPAYDGANWQPLLVDAQRHLQADILASALPTGSATAANQATVITALQLIDDLNAALESVSTDRLIVRGEDQMFTYLGSLHTYTVGTISGANGHLDSITATAGEIWKVTTTAIADVTTPTTQHRFHLRSPPTSYRIHTNTAAFAANQFSYLHSDLWLDAGDLLRCNFLAGLPGDTCVITLIGHRMTLET